tara:strand:- start:1313 stop:2167 length:855 start_codon:yes stop_codon:yes gene_type:complete
LNPESDKLDTEWIDKLPPLREVIEKHSLWADKKLGQNFILDTNITDKIVASAGDLKGLTVFEIGPGPGGLTRSLLKSNAEKIIAIEFDNRAVEALRDLEDKALGRLEVVKGDALELDLMSMAPKARRAIIANLPYNIATPLLISWLKQIYADEKAFEKMALMFQKEVAERIVSPSGQKSFGRLSVLSQWLCKCTISFDLPPSVFLPPPKVTSSVVSFRPKGNQAEMPIFENVEKVTQAGFGQRRKMIRKSMKDYCNSFSICAIEDTNRAENLEIKDFLCIAKKL